MNQNARCYDVLGIRYDASLDDIRQAYKKAALRWHPDKNPDGKTEATKRFQECVNAYGVLVREKQEQAMRANNDPIYSQQPQANGSSPFAPFANTPSFAFSFAPSSTPPAPPFFTPSFTSPRQANAPPQQCAGNSRFQYSVFEQARTFVSHDSSQSSWQPDGLFDTIPSFEPAPTYVSNSSGGVQPQVDPLGDSYSMPEGLPRDFPHPWNESDELDLLDIISLNIAYLDNILPDILPNNVVPSNVVPNNFLPNDVFYEPPQYVQYQAPEGFPNNFQNILFTGTPEELVSSQPSAGPPGLDPIALRNVQVPGMLNHRVTTEISIVHSQMNPPC